MDLSYSGEIMVDILLKHGQVLTMDKSRRIIRDGAVAVEDGRIVAVGKTKEVKRSFSGAEFELDVDGNCIMPGLVDTHTHLNQMLGKGFGDDMELDTWVENALGVLMKGITKEGYFHAVRLGCLEAIKSGTTSLLAFEKCNLSAFERCDILPGIGEDVVKAISESGARGVLGWVLQDKNIEENLDLPLPTMEENMTNLTTAVRRWDGSYDGRIRVWPALNTGLVCTSELMLQAKDLATKHGLGVTVHIDETPETKIWNQNYPRIAASDGAEYYDEIVGLDSNVLLVHCCWTTNKGIARIAASGASVSHNTISNMYLASGITNIPQMLEQGINVALGVDGATSNNNQDMFEVMKTTALLHKVHTLNPQIITAEQVLDLTKLFGAGSQDEP